MYQDVVMREPAFVSLCGEEETERDAALFPNTLKPKRDFSPDLAVAFEELILRIQIVKVCALRRQTETCSAQRFELAVGGQRESAEPRSASGLP
jgi:hypothetical protein